MSEDERRLLESAGNYCRVDPSAPGEPSWRSCRVVLTTKRLVLDLGESSTALPHAKVRVPEETPEVVDAPETLVLSVGESLVAIEATDVEAFPERYYRANLDGVVLLARPRAVIGGVVQDDATYSKAKLAVDRDSLTLHFPGGDQESIGMDAIEGVDGREETVQGETRPVLALAYTDDDRRIEIQISGTQRHTSVLGALCRAALSDGDDADLTKQEKQVLMALYSGVAPFEMADFVGITVDEVEEIYQSLLEKEAVDEVRTRTEVALNGTGRNLASQAMNEE
ncbi:MAG: CheF family chemotaxis protein [Halococcoides sp.]